MVTARAIWPPKFHFPTSEVWYQICRWLPQTYKQQTSVCWYEKIHSVWGKYLSLSHCRAFRLSYHPICRHHHNCLSLHCLPEEKTELITLSPLPLPSSSLPLSLPPPLFSLYVVRLCVRLSIYWNPLHWMMLSMKPPYYVYQVVYYELWKVLVCRIVHFNNDVS